MPTASPQPAFSGPRVLTSRKPSQIPEIPAATARILDEVAERYAFRVNDYYLGLIDWSDPADPIRRLVVPEAGEDKELREAEA